MWSTKMKNKGKKIDQMNKVRRRIKEKKILHQKL
jgi:hypothetical protein